MVQSPHLQQLLGRALQQSPYFSRILNAGAGEGGYSPLLLALPGVKSVIESDYSYGKQMPNRLDSKQSFCGASLAYIPLADHTIDLVLCTEVLEHIEEDHKALDELARIVAPGGWLLLTVPTPPAVPDPAHVREGYRSEELTAMLTERGFEVVEIRFCMYFFFRFLLSTWPRLSWNPRLWIRTLAKLDNVFSWGPPMDLMVLARAKS